MAFLRFFMLLALIVWIGGIIFFAFVEAPTLFHLLPTRIAGNVVSGSLATLHDLGLISGLVFLICSLAFNRIKDLRFRPMALSHVLVLAMMLFTIYSQFSIMPRMAAMRNYFGGEGDVHPGQQAQFDRLHAWSTRLEGGVLFLGLGVVVLTARRFGTSN